MCIYYFIDCSIDNGHKYWRSEVRFRKSSRQSNQVSNLFTLIGWAGKAFIRYRRCLLPKAKEITNSDLKRCALFGLVDKVGIVSVMEPNTIWELC